MVELILGGARSGKSRLAQQLAYQASGHEVVYIATATAFDDEMKARIAAHQADRPLQWQVVESPLDLAKTIERYAKAPTLLVDCLTLWLNNELYHDSQQDFAQVFERLIAACQTAKHVILVSNEVGLGVVPIGEVSRRFVDEAGRMNQTLAQRADKVVFVVAGLPQVLKGKLA